MDARVIANKPLERPGVNPPAVIAAPSAGRSAPSRSATCGMRLRLSSERNP